jgi:hypothetical protein
MTPTRSQGGSKAATPTPESGKKSQLTSSMANKAERNRERSKRKKIRRFFALSSQDIHKAAKKSGQTIKDYFEQLYNEMIQKKKNLLQDPWVEASFWQWVEVKDKPLKGNTVRKIDGVDYMKTGHKNKPLSYICDP